MMFFILRFRQNRHICFVILIIAVFWQISQRTCLFFDGMTDFIGFSFIFVENLDNIYLYIYDLMYVGQNL